MFPYSLLQASDIDSLGDGVFSVLDRVGVLCQNQEILEAFQQAGARVDFERETAAFPRRMCQTLLDQLRDEASRITAKEAITFKPPNLPHLSTQIAQFLYDYKTQQRRSGNRLDFIDLIKFGSVLHPETPVGHSLLLTDVPPMLEPLEAALLLAEYAHRPAPTFAWNVRQIDYLIEMGEILGISDWFNWGAICFAHPLRFDRDVADKFVRRVRAGVPTGLTAMPVAGVTTPVPVAGFIAVAAAEIFATWLAARSLNPEVPLTGSIWGGAMDMKTGAVSYCSFDAMRYAFVLAEFLRKWSGKILPVGGGEYCDAKQPGYYAALEKAYKAMTIAAFTGQHPDVGQGMLEEGKTLCPVQLLLEREFSSGVEIFGKPFKVSSETMCLDTILDVGFGLTKNHLDTDQTLYHFREHLWCPEQLDRSGWNGSDTDAVVLSRMQDQVQGCLSNYRKPAVDPDQLEKMRNVVACAQNALLS